MYVVGSSYDPSGQNICKQNDMFFVVSHDVLFDKRLTLSINMEKYIRDQTKKKKIKKTEQNSMVVFE